VSHDVEDTLEFERVLVISAGRIVEDGAPAQLSKDPTSQYARLSSAARTLRGELGSAAHWRRQVLVQGRLSALEST